MLVLFTIAQSPLEVAGFHVNSDLCNTIHIQHDVNTVIPPHPVDHFS